MAHPVTHENVWDRNRDRADARFDPDPDIPGFGPIFEAGGKGLARLWASPSGCRSESVGEA